MQCLAISLPTCRTWLILPQLRWTQTRQFSMKVKQTITKQIVHEETIKKSKFVAIAGKAVNMIEAMTFLDSVKDIKATHNCWAFNSLAVQRCSDDGEPSGTAGRPILAALEKENIINTMVVVTRYYGGIKLGTGGLARAYGGTAQSALKLAERVDYVPCEVVTIMVPQSDVGAIYRLLKPYQLHTDLPTESDEYKVCNDTTSNVEGNIDDRKSQSHPHSLYGIHNTTTTEFTSNDTDDSITVSAIVPTNEILTLKKKFEAACQGRGSFQQSELKE